MDRLCKQLQAIENHLSIWSGTRLSTRLNISQTSQQLKMYVQIRKFSKVNKIAPDHTAW